MQVTKQRKSRLLSIKRRIVQDYEIMFAALIEKTQGDGAINTIYIEHLNVNFRQPSLD